jgi:SAM-dependent methyltransferase
MSGVRTTLIKLHWILSSQFGFDPKQFLQSVVAVPRFIRDWSRFRKTYSGPLTLVPCLHDWNEKAGAAHSEYFMQDLLVARWIFDASPRRHVDVGSRIDGLVAHVASFREIEVFDVRPLSVSLPGVVFKQRDLMQPVDSATAGDAYCDSLSCLHAIEHFGLGRYGDPIDAQGYERGMANMGRLVAPGGRLYLSTPIGRERVEFNANRVFDPRTIIRCAAAHSFTLRELVVISSGGLVSREPATDESLLKLAEADYNLGVFVFEKARP